MTKTHYRRDHLVHSDATNGAGLSCSTLNEHGLDMKAGKATTATKAIIALAMQAVLPTVASGQRMNIRQKYYAGER